MPTVRMTAPPTDYQLEMARIDRQRKMIEQLQAEGLQDSPQGQMVSGIYVKPHWTQGLAKALKSGLGAYQAKQLEKEAKTLAETERKTQAQEMADFMRTMRGTPEVARNVTGTEDVTGAPTFSGEMGSPAVPGNRNAAMEMGMSARNPRVAAMADQLRMQDMTREDQALEWDRIQKLGGTPTPQPAPQPQPLGGGMLLGNENFAARSSPEFANADGFAGDPKKLAEQIINDPNIPSADKQGMLAQLNQQAASLPQPPKAQTPMFGGMTRESAMGASLSSNKVIAAAGKAALAQYNAADMKTAISQPFQKQLQDEKQTFTGGQGDLNRDNRIVTTQMAQEGANQRTEATQAGANQRAQTAAEKKAAIASRLPPAALKLRQEELDSIGSLSSVNADLGKIVQQIDDKKLSFGPVENLLSKGKNITGNSDEKSRNFASFMATMEKQRNATLLLNKGVQTEGDAIRAWKEIFDHPTDTQLVKDRLVEIQALNKRAADLRKMNVDVIHKNYGLDPMDVSSYENVPPSIDGAAAQVRKSIAPRSVTTMDEAMALPAGTKFMLNGRVGTVQ